MEKRTDFLPLAKATIDPEELKAVEEVLRSGWLTTGAKVKEFEENMQQYLSIKKAIGLTSCTAGLHIALAALGIGPGDEVIVPAYTFVATAHVVEWLGAKSVLVDVEKDTFNIDSVAIEKAITPKTKAIIPVHYAGHACDLGVILQIAKKYNLPVIEDAAHAIGTEYGGKKIGNHSNAAVFSFYVTKTITTAEGGMIVTNNEEFGKKLKSYAYFGMDKDAFNRYSEKGSWFYQIVGPGYKYNMNNIQGAIGVEQLKKLEQFIIKRRELAQHYNRLLKDVSGVITPTEKSYTKHAFHLYPLLLNTDKITRDQFILRLKEYNVGTSVHFIPLHMHPFYQNKYNFNKGDFPIAEWLFEKEVSLPMYPGMTLQDVEYVVDAIKEILK